MVTYRYQTKKNNFITIFSYLHEDTILQKSLWSKICIQYYIINVVKHQFYHCYFLDLVQWYMSRI
jgi:hypothetical protein